MQTLAITITGAPIPFAKLGKFPPESIMDIIKQMKKDIQNGKSALNQLKMEFHNKVNDVTSSIKNGLERNEKTLKDLTADGYAGLQKALPGLFGRTGAVATARETLLSRIGSITDYANDPQNKMFGMTVSQWSVAGNTLFEAFQSFKNHTNELAGVNTDDVLLIGNEIQGNVILGGTINVSSTSNVATVNLSKTTYPIVNVGSTVVVNSALYIVTGKAFTIQSGGSVSFDSGNTTVTTASVSTLNLANIVLATGSSLKIVPGMYINVNNEIKQVDSINARGDFLTVTRPFRNSNTGVSLYKEVGFTINTNFGSTNTDINVYKNDVFVCNSVCLDNVITGNGTSFSSVLSVGDKIYYDDLEYFVEAVTNTTIIVDAPLRGKSDMAVYKVVDEQFVNRVTEPYGADDILSDFSVANQMFEGITNPDGSSFMSDFSTKYRASNGSYVTVAAYNPTYVTGSLEKGPAYMVAINKTMQGLIDDLQDDAIKYLSDTELGLYLEAKTNEIEELRKNLDDSIREDKAAINAVKGMIKGLLKLWEASCSKKQRGADAVEEPDDTYLESILVPNPVRQGCDATRSDLPEILDATDAELTTPETEPVAPPPPEPLSDVDLDLFNETPDAIYVLERQRNPGDPADIVIDDDPESQLPAPLDDPCVKPC